MSLNPNISTSFIAQLYARLKQHRGSIKEVAEKSGVHRVNTVRVLRGDWYNEKVIVAAVQVLSLREKRRQEVLNKAGELMRELSDAQSL
jgi:lambda repressor-like predicted transcriptional regulator